MSREVHVRFWEGAGLQCPALLDSRAISIDRAVSTNQTSAVSG
jgi:hypothetical protein